MEFLAWWTTDRIVAVVGFAVTVAGTAIAIWQLLRTRKAAESARAASQATRRSLRAADLRRTLDVSIEVGRRLDQTNRREQITLYLGDWLVSYQRIFGLLTRGDEASRSRYETFLDRLEQTRGEVLVAREALATPASWREYSRSFLRDAMVQFGAAAESILVSQEDEEATGHAV